MSGEAFLVRRQREAVTVLAGLVLGAGAVSAALEPDAGRFGEVHQVPVVPFEGPGSNFDSEFEFEFEQPPTLEPPTLPEIEVPTPDFEPPPQPPGPDEPTP